MVDKILSLIFGTKHERDVKRLTPLVARINDIEPRMKKLTNDEMRRLSNDFRTRLENGESTDALLPEAFALVRETGIRTLGMRHFDVQLMGGIVLHEGKISEMKTGEGKTLVATLPMYLNAITGKGAHLVTVNDYLARRDAEWMSAIYRFLGLSVGIIQHDMNHPARQEAYAADITYGTNNEFGFDYLRDNMVDHKLYRVQRKLHYAIVDEVDSILIDEARTPLIISGSVEESTKKYYLVNKIIPSLKKDIDYTVNEKDRVVALTEDGVHHVEQLLKLDNLYSNQNIEVVHYVNQALKAHTLFTRDIDYIVKEDEVVIVDEFTGRLMPGRRFSDGLHQALEAKENVTIAKESQTLATVTFQNFFRMYQKLAGMTGTADTEAVEFKKIYNLDVVVVPTNVDVARVDRSDMIYKTEKEKFNAIVRDIAERREKGQPSLVGTISIEKSELLSNHLKHKGISHNVLNAKFHEREASIVAEAGSPGMVTIATNMAGRGTDIVLGGRKMYVDDLDAYEPVHDKSQWDEFKLLSLREKLDDAEKVAQNMVGRDKEKAEMILRMGREWLSNHVKVVDAGGLHIIGTERHEARRIDNQLRGRSGRQGDPGSSRFYLSLEDNLMRIFGSDRIYRMMDTLGMKEDEPIESRIVSRAIASAQKRVEGRNFEIRKHLLEYDDVMNSQREYIYKRRDEILEGEDISLIIDEFMDDVIADTVDQFAKEKKNVADWEIEALTSYIQSKFQINIRQEINNLEKLDINAFETALKESIVRRHKEKEKLIGPENMRHAERMIALQVIDSKWREHLYSMDQMRDGIWTVGYGGKNPLVEYKLNGFRIFQESLFAIKQEIVEFLMKVQFRENDSFKDEPTAPPEEILGDEVHQELGQFGASQSAFAQGAAIHSASRAKNKETEHIEGGTKRKKTRRSRRG
jgi:preprotein translocase subunit SecA